MGSDAPVTVLVGVDIGQKRDPTAVCVAEVEARLVAGRRETHYLVRHLERLPLGTPYPAVADSVTRIADRVRARTGARPTVFVDATGVGQAVVDLLRGQVRSGEVVAVWFTAGGRRTERRDPSGRRVSLGKAFMVSRLQAMLGGGRLHLPKTAEADALTRELLNYELRVDANGHARAGAFRVGTHDDLVTAVGLAVQVDSLPGTGALRLPLAIE